LIFLHFVTNMRQLPQNLEEIQKYRDLANRGMILISRTSMEGLHSKKIMIPTTGNHQLEGMVYYPIQREGLLPLVVFFHGGGHVFGGNGTQAEICADIARKTPAVVVAVDYRLAPETKFPGDVEDCYDATNWISKHSNQLEGDINRLVVIGDSAGGALALQVTLLAQEKGGPKISHQILIYPSLDPYHSTPSFVQYGDGYVLTKELSWWFVQQYYKGPLDKHHPIANPLKSKEYNKIPDTLIQVAEWDILRDEGILMAKILSSLKQNVKLTIYNQTVHGFYNFGIFFPQIYESALEEVVYVIKNLNDRM